MTYRSVLAGAAAVLLPLLAGAAESLIIDHVTVIEGAGRAPQPDMAVIIQGARIAAVTPSQLAGSIPGRGSAERGPAQKRGREADVPRSRAISTPE